MLKRTGDKVDKMEFTISKLFSTMTDEDFILVHKSGQLKKFCNALSVDLNTSQKNFTVYEA
jgi:hypothetical protein